LNVREQGRSESEPGRLKKVKAIGWWLEEESLAQISMNLVDYKTTNLQQAFEECEKDAAVLRVSLCGSQIVGLVPLEAILLAADYYIKRDGLLVLDEDKKVKLVTQRLGLNTIFSFNPNERIIDYLIKAKLDSSEEERFQSMSLRGFASAIAARTSLPGGGCVAALVATLGSALSNMVAYLTYGNRKFEKHDAEVRQLLPSLHAAYIDLMQLIDQDAIAFNAYVVSFI
jgi:glutamate formiminotransferase/formiminotetrahydrofolate cyclodeaminase